MARSAKKFAPDPGPTCEAAKSEYLGWCQKHQRECAATSDGVSPGVYSSVLNDGAYLRACDLPATTEVRVCVAVQHGKAVGVTVESSPHDADLDACVASKVRGLSFPDQPRLDVTRTVFAAD